MHNIKPMDYELTIQDIDPDKLSEEFNGILIYSDFSLRNAKFEKFTVEQVRIIGNELARRHRLRLTSFRTALCELESALDRICLG